MGEIFYYAPYAFQCPTEAHGYAPIDYTAHTHTGTWWWSLYTLPRCFPLLIRSKEMVHFYVVFYENPVGLPFFSNRHPSSTEII